MTSTLYIVATPIGNLEDITLRALNILKEVDFVVTEDMRFSKRMLQRYEIDKPRFTYRDENKKSSTQKILDILDAGKKLALISDSGTPLISDPGFKLVQKVKNAGHSVVTVPGASAVTAALSIAGVPTDRFTFVGFLPKKGGSRLETIKEYGKLDATLVLYESPYRIKKTLQDIYDILGDRIVAVAKELTKIHETVYLGKLSSVIDEIPETSLKGEFVILVAKDGFINGFHYI